MNLVKTNEDFCCDRLLEPVLEWPILGRRLGFWHKHMRIIIQRADYWTISSGQVATGGKPRMSLDDFRPNQLVLRHIRAVTGQKLRDAAGRLNSSAGPRS